MNDEKKTVESNPVTGNPLPELETVPKPIALMETVTLVSLALAIGSLVLFAWIAGSLSHAWVRNFDFTIRNKVHEYASPALTKWMIWISFVGGDGLVAAAILSVTLFLAFRWRRAAVWMLVNISGTLILDLTLKYSFARLRPTPFFVPMPRTPSFPSGHSLFSFCLWSAGRFAGGPHRLATVAGFDLDVRGITSRRNWPVADLSRCPLSQRCDRRLSHRDVMGEHHGRSRPNEKEEKREIHGYEFKLTSPVESRRR